MEPTHIDRPDPHVEAAVSGDPPQPTREADLLRAGQSLTHIVRDMGDSAHRYALQDLADYLTGRLGAPGSSWPVRLPVPDSGRVVELEAVERAARDLTDRYERNWQGRLGAIGGQMFDDLRAALDS